MRSVRAAISGVVLVAACGSVLKPPAPNRRLDIRVTGAVFEAGNGYQFVAIPDAGATVVRVDVRYPVGAADDPPGKEGLAHLVEHLLFAVEVKRDAAVTSIGAELGRVALAWNAETTADSTTYETVAAPDALDDLLELEVDRLAVGCAGLTPEIVAREREVVLNELRSRQGASGAAVERVIDEAVFPAGHPYRRVDSVETVAKLELADVCAFLDGPYQRDKAIVVVSGAITGEALQTAAGHHYGRLGNRNLAARARPPAVRAKAGTVKLKADVDDPLVIATWPLPPMSERDYRLLEIAMPFIAPRVDAFAFTYHWGHSADWGILGGAYAPVLAVWVEVDSLDHVGDAKEAIAKAAEFAARVVYRPGDDRESDSWRLLWQSRAESLLARWESLGSRNDMFADFLQYTPADTGYLISRVDELTKATPSETHDLVKAWLAPRAARFLVIEPTGATAAASGPRTYAGGAEEHAVGVDPALADQPLDVPAAKLALDTVRYTAPNGLSVILWPDGATPVVHARLVIDSGWAHDPANNEGVATLVGASDVYADSLVFTRRELAANVDEMIVALGLELRSPGYELDDDDKGYMKGRLRARGAAERAKYERELADAVYGDHPYARGSMTEASLDAIHRDLVMDWARETIVPRNAVLVVAGKLDADLVKRHIAYNTEHVSGGKDSADVDAIPHARGIRVSGVDPRPSPTVELDVLFPGPAGLDRTYARRLVLREMLGSRLQFLRGKQALTYGMSVAYYPRRAGGMWRISGEVDANRAAEAAAALVAALDEIRTDAESNRAAFVLARQRVLASLVATTGDSAAIADRLEYLARFDLPDDFYDQIANDVSGLTLADFQRFITGELDVEDQVFGAYGNAEAVDAAFDAAKKW
jgi:zinc protease